MPDDVFLNQAKEAEQRRDFLGARVLYMKCVEAWKQVNKTGEHETEFQNAARDYEEFVKRDPIFGNLILALLPTIKANPGILQSNISSQFTSVDWPTLFNYNRQPAKEDIYYALYFAEKLGIIRRVKQGRSYELFAENGIKLIPSVESYHQINIKTADRIHQTTSPNESIGRWQSILIIIIVIVGFIIFGIYKYHVAMYPH